MDSFHLVGVNESINNFLYKKIISFILLIGRFLSTIGFSLYGPGDFLLLKRLNTLCTLSSVIHLNFAADVSLL